MSVIYIPGECSPVPPKASLLFSFFADAAPEEKRSKEREGAAFISPKQKSDGWDPAKVTDSKKRSVIINKGDNSSYFKGGK